MPIALDGIRTCISGIRAHSASDCTTTAGTPPVSRNKHFRHSPVSSIVKQSCMKRSNSSAGPRRQASARTSAESDEACQRKTKDRADGMREKVPIALDGIRTCVSGIRARSASDCTTMAGTPPVSRNKHFRHSPVSSIMKQSCMKHSNSYVCVCMRARARTCACAPALTSPTPPRLCVCMRVGVGVGRGTIHAPSTMLFLGCFFNCLVLFSPQPKQIAGY